MKRLLEGLWDLAAFLDWDHNCVVDFEDETLPLNLPSIPLVNFNLVGGHSFFLWLYLFEWHTAVLSVGANWIDLQIISVRKGRNGLFCVQ